MQRAVLLASALVFATANEAHACERDARLEEAASLLLADARELSAVRVLDAVRAAGSSVIAPRALASPAEDDGSARRFLDAIEHEGPGPFACGEARTDGRRLLVVGRARGGIRFAEDSQRVFVTVVRTVRPSYLTLRGRDGSVVRVELLDDVLARGVPVPPDLARPIDVQLVGDDGSGPEPLAELRVTAPAPTRYVARGARVDVVDEGATPAVPAVASDDAREALEALRRAHGARDVRPNRLLTAEAEAHARSVCVAGRVAHELEHGANPEARLRRRGVTARVVGETIARAESSSAAFDALVRSPSHFAALVDRRFTDVGIGRADDPAGHVCLVVLLAAWPRVTR